MSTGQACAASSMAAELGVGMRRVALRSAQSDGTLSPLRFPHGAQTDSLRHKGRRGDLCFLDADAHKGLGCVSVGHKMTLGAHVSSVLMGTAAALVRRVAPTPLLTRKRVTRGVCTPTSAPLTRPGSDDA